MQKWQTHVVISVHRYNDISVEIVLFLTLNLSVCFIGVWLRCHQAAEWLQVGLTVLI
jgi:hypothetical protein